MAMQYKDLTHYIRGLMDLFLSTHMPTYSRITITHYIRCSLSQLYSTLSQAEWHISLGFGVVVDVVVAQ